jgi:hypothetical protein
MPATTAAVIFAIAFPLNTTSTATSAGIRAFAPSRLLLGGLACPAPHLAGTGAGRKVPGRGQHR